MHEQLQVRPHLAQVACPGYFQHLFEHDQHPRGHSRQGGNVPSDHLIHHARQLFVPVGQQRRLPVGRGAAVGPLWRPAHQDGRQVAHQHAVLGALQASPQAQGPSGEHPRVGMVAQVGRYQVVCRQEMVAAQRFVADGDVFALGIGRARGFGEIPDPLRPYHGGFSPQGPFDVRVEVLVAAHRHLPREVFVAHPRGKSVLLSEGRRAPLFQQIRQDTALLLHRLVTDPFYPSPAAAQVCRKDRMAHGRCSFFKPFPAVNTLQGTTLGSIYRQPVPVSADPSSGKCTNRGRFLSGMAARQGLLFPLPVYQNLLRSGQQIERMSSRMVSPRRSACSWVRASV